MFRQRLLALAAGYEDLNDHDSLCNDPGFMAVVGTQRIAGSSNLCRFENRFDRISIDKLNQTLLEAFCIATKQLNLLPKYRKKNYRCLFLDVDSTFVELHGNQEEKSYNGHYGMSCLAPVLCYLQNYLQNPAFSAEDSKVSVEPCTATPQMALVFGSCGTAGFTPAIFMPFKKDSKPR